MDPPIMSLRICGTFRGIRGEPIPDAAVHGLFLGDPPTTLGTSFDLGRTAARTTDSGEFELELPLGDATRNRADPVAGPLGGLFLVLAAKDARYIGYTVARGDELSTNDVLLTALPREEVRGTIVDAEGRGVEGACVELSRYRLTVGREPLPTASIRFTLTRTAADFDARRDATDHLRVFSGTDGEFCLPEVAACPGGLELAVSRPNYATLRIVCIPGQSLAPVVMDAAAIVRVQIDLPGGKTAEDFEMLLEGLSEDPAPACGIPRSPGAARRYQWRYGITDASGRIEFRDLPPGSYTVRYLGGPEKTWAIPAIPVPKLRRGEERCITAPAVPGTILNGSVLEAGTRKPIARAEVRFESESYPRTASTIQAAYTDEGGKFTFRYPIAPGLCNIIVSARRGGKRSSRAYAIILGRDSPAGLCLELPEP